MQDRRLPISLQVKYLSCKIGFIETARQDEFLSIRMGDWSTSCVPFDVPRWFVSMHNSRVLSESMLHHHSVNASVIEPLSNDPALVITVPPPLSGQYISKASRCQGRERSNNHTHCPDRNLLARMDNVHQIERVTLAGYRVSFPCLRPPYADITVLCRATFHRSTSCHPRVREGEE